MSWPFFQNPMGVVLIAALLSGYCVVVVGAKRLVSWPLLVAVGSWWAYAAWEWYCTSGGFNIRVDLLVLPWLLMAISLFGVLHPFVAKNAM